MTKLWTSGKKINLNSKCTISKVRFSANEQKVTFDIVVMTGDGKNKSLLWNSSGASDDWFLCDKEPQISYVTPFTHSGKSPITYKKSSLGQGVL